MSAMPRSDEDLTHAAADPYPLYARLRALGPVVYLIRHQVVALTTHAAVRTALEHPACFGPPGEPGGGLAAGGGSTHTLLPGPPDRPSARRPKGLSGHIEQAARRLAGACLAEGRMDAAEVAIWLAQDVALLRGLPPQAAEGAQGLDTAAACATATTLCLLAAHPEQYRLLRARRAGAAAAVHEALRLEAPIQHTVRRVRAGLNVCGTELEPGTPVWLLYGSAGRDVGQWGPRADRYIIQRPGNHDHLALGHSPRACPGRTLAIAQATELIAALARRAPYLVLDGEPVRDPSDPLRGWRRVPLLLRSGLPAVR